MVHNLFSVVLNFPTRSEAPWKRGGPIILLVSYNVENMVVIENMNWKIKIE